MQNSNRGVLPQVHFTHMCTDGECAAAPSLGGCVVLLLRCRCRCFFFFYINTLQTAEYEHRQVDGEGGGVLLRTEPSGGRSSAAGAASRRTFFWHLDNKI